MLDRLSLSMRASHILVALLVVIALVFALVAWSTGDRFYLRLATEALIFAGLALSVDTLLGYTGLLPLGQALFFGFGAYVSALVLREAPSFWTAIGVVFLSTLAVGLTGGVIASRARGVYFALISFGLAQVVSKVVFNIRELGASDGLRGIPVLDIEFGLFSISTNAPLAFFLFTLAFILLLYALAAYLLDTPFGRVLIALKANEKRVPFLGYSVFGARLAAYILAAEIAALSGALYPMLRGFVSPELMFFAVSGNAIIGVILGGVGTLAGALYGSILLTLMRSIVGTWTEHHLIVIGLVFIIVVIFLPRGLLGFVRPRLEAVLSKRQKP